MALSSESTIVIQSTKGLAQLGLGELWAYREVIFFLAWRTIKVRYKQTIFGAAWAIIQPIITMIIFTVIFGRIAKVPTDGIPYPLFVFAALLPWQFFSASISAGSDSLVGGGSILKQVYFPRLAMPLASIASCLVDFALAFLVMEMLFIPCVATVGAIRQETGSWRWTLANVMFLLVVSVASGIIAYRVATVLHL